MPPRRELVSQLVYREAGQIFQREGAAGEPPPLRRMIAAPTRTVTEEDLKTQESRKRLIRKVKLQSPWCSSWSGSPGCYFSQTLLV